MTFRILPAFAALSSLTLFSCYPYPEPPPREREQKRPDTTVTDAEQQKIKAQRDRMKEAKKEQEALADRPAADTTPPPKPPERKSSIPVAQPVPGKEGFVFSPYNNKVIDVRDMPSGQLVADPTYPASEKKHFRVP